MLEGTVIAQRLLARAKIGHQDHCALCSVQREAKHRLRQALTHAPDKKRQLFMHDTKRQSSRKAVSDRTISVHGS